MREIERTSQFKRDYKRERKGRHRTTLDASLAGVISSLIRDTPLDARYRDHPLTGDWRAIAIAM